MSVIEEIKDKLDIVTYIGQYVPLKKAGGYYKANCPFHTEKTPSFMVSAERQTWRCYGACGAGGDVLDFAKRQHGWTMAEAIQELAKQAGIEIKQAERHDNLERLYGLLAAATEGYHKALLDYPGAQHARDYVTGRGLSPETVESFGLGYAPDHWHAMTANLRQLGYSDADIVAAGIAREGKKGLYDLFRNRLMIPIYDKRGRVIGFGARALNPDDEPKYLNSPQSPVFDKSRVLFGLNRVPRNVESMVIVEGYMDVITAFQAGYTNVVAQMGTALTDAQVALLNMKTIIVALDGDSAGQQAARRDLEQVIKIQRDVRVATLPEGQDPDDLLRQTPDRWPTLIDQAMPVAEYIIDTETTGLEDNAPIAEREALARRLLPLLMATENNIYRMDNVQALALRLRIPERELLALARQAKTPTATPEPSISTETTAEQLCLSALLADPQALYSIQRAFRQREVADFGVDDFGRTSRQGMQALIDALAQDDLEPIEYVRQALHDDSFKPMAAVNQESLTQAAFYLRLRRLSTELDELRFVGDLGRIQARLGEKARVLDALGAIR